MKKLYDWCKTLWNPIAVMLIGACVGVAVTLPLTHEPTGNSLLEKWQSLIGSIVASTVAIGLFQLQRRIDRQSAIESRKASAEEALFILRTKTNAKYFAEATVQFRDRATEIATQASQDLDYQLGLQFKQRIQPEVLLAIERLTKHCERSIVRLKSVPRDEYLSNNLKFEIYYIECTFDWWIDCTDEFAAKLETFKWPSLELSEAITEFAESIEFLGQTIVGGDAVDHQSNTP